MFKTFYCAIFVAAFPAALFAGPVEAEFDWGSVNLLSDVRTGLGGAFEGLWGQFFEPESASSLLLGGVATWGLDRVDDDIFDALEGNDFFTSDALEIIGDEAAIAVAFTPVVTYAIARYTEDEKLRQFSMELFSGMTLAWVETAALSQFGFHRRPRDEAGDEADSFFDTAFRGKSSFPSGHVIAATVLALKTYDYYGWKPALVPAAIAVTTSLNRTSNGSHFASDIGAGVTLAVASHLITKKIFRGGENGVQIGFSPVRGTGGMVTVKLRF